MSDSATNLDGGWLVDGTDFTKLGTELVVAQPLAQQPLELFFDNCVRDSRIEFRAREAPLGLNLVYGFQPNYKPPRGRINRNRAR